MFAAGGLFALDQNAKACSPYFEPPEQAFPPDFSSGSCDLGATPAEVFFLKMIEL